MVQVAWATLGILTATIVAMFVYHGGKFDAVNARIDGLAADMSAKFDAVNARFDGISARIDALSARMDTHIDQHHRAG